jgi:hypothetical protein
MTMLLWSQGRLGRTTIAVLFCVVLSVIFAASTHLVPQGSRQLITVTHQLRRVLSRAERESLKSILALLAPSDRRDAAPALPQRVRVSAELPGYGVSRSADLPEPLEPAGIFLSPVLNL